MKRAMNRMDVGPVFWCECRRVSRQWWFYAVRSILVAGLLLGLTAAWWAEASRPALSQTSGMIARVGERYFEVIVLAQVSMVLLAAPAATAGTFCTEMARGHVCLMLVAGMTPIEILIGTLGARLLPVLGIVACISPVLMLSSYLGGISAYAVLRLELITVGSAVLGCVLATAVSMGARRLHEALMATYALLVAWVLGYPTLFMIRMTSLGGYLPGWWTQWFLDVNPYWLTLEPIVSPASDQLEEIWLFLGGTMGLSLVLVLLAAWRLRAAALNSSGRALARSWLSRLPSFRPLVSLDANPVFWRECRMQQPSRWLRLLWGLYVAGAVLFSVMAVVECQSRGTKRTFWAGPYNGFQAAVGLGLLSLLTPAALAEERARGSLEVLLSTPLSTRSLVLSKWLAYYRAVPVLALLPAVVAIPHAIPFQRWLGVLLVFGMILAHGAAVTSLGLALATWISRIDRALILSASASVLVTVAWVPFVVLVCGGNDLSLGLACASPVLGVGVLTSEMARASSEMWPFRAGWVAFWIFVYCGMALSLLWATLASFDRCLGRITPRSGRLAHADANASGFERRFGPRRPAPGRVRIAWPATVRPRDEPAGPG
jgi:hypothetical protein